MTRAGLLLALAVAGCASGRDDVYVASSPEIAPRADWREVATEHDRDRLRRWRSAWTKALAEARAAGRADELAREGALLQPDAALSDARPPRGLYSCRVVKLGGGTLGLVSYPPFRCRVGMGGTTDHLVKLTGSQRHVGRLYDDGDSRMVFLGTLELGDETRPQRYGVDRSRDVAGVLERVGERRWRLVQPYPAFESTLDVLELTPAS